MRSVRISPTGLRSAATERARRLWVARPGGHRHTGPADERGNSLPPVAATAPVFVIGIGRSGTTALAAAMKRHPAVYGGGPEVHEAPWVADVGEFVGRFHDDTNPVRRDYYRGTLAEGLDELYQRLRRFCVLTAFGETVTPTEPSDPAEPDAAGQRWLVKTPPDEQQAHGLTQLFPHGRFVYIVRNGYDVVESHRRFPNFAHLSFDDICTRWADAIDRFAYAPGLDATIVIRQEALVLDPAGTLGEVFDFLGLPPDPAPAEFAAANLIHPLDEPTKRDVDVREVLAERGPVWAGWTDEQRATFHTTCGAAMERLGYPLVGQG